MPWDFRNHVAAKPETVFSVVVVLVSGEMDACRRVCFSELSSGSKGVLDLVLLQYQYPR